MHPDADIREAHGCCRGGREARPGSDQPTFLTVYRNTSVRSTSPDVFTILIVCSLSFTPETENSSWVETRDSL